MGFFRNLWDEAVVGSSLDSDVNKFRRYNSLVSRSSVPLATNNSRVSRSITILRTNTLSGSGSNPPSPAGSSAAGSPLSATSPREEFKSLTQKKTTKGTAQRQESRSPDGYDWIMWTSMDR